MLPPVEEGLEPEEVPEGEVEVASRVVETGVATESVAFFLPFFLDGGPFAFDVLHPFGNAFGER